MAGLAIFMAGHYLAEDQHTPYAISNTGASQSADNVETVAYTAKDGKRTRGTCVIFVGKVTVFSCVPSTTPKGSKVARIWEDGSAKYANGSVFDGDAGTFRGAK